MPAKEAVIVSHGQPGDPLPQDQAMDMLAAEVATHLPGWTVRGATLASPGCLNRALAGLTQPMVYPFFMAEGYFTGEVLPKRLAENPIPARQLPAFGTDPALPALIGVAAMTGAREAGFVPEETALLLAAHGSQVSPASRIATRALAEMLTVSLPFRTIVTGFIEEAPFLTQAAGGLGQAICLPLFTLTAGHVVNDVPEALAGAGFEGVLLGPIGAHPAVPRLIAAALERQVQRATA